MASFWLVWSGAGSILQCLVSFLGFFILAFYRPGRTPSLELRLIFACYVLTFLLSLVFGHIILQNWTVGDIVYGVAFTVVFGIQAYRSCIEILYFALCIDTLTPFFLIPACLHTGDFSPFIVALVILCLRAACFIGATKDLPSDWEMGRRVSIIAHVLRSVNR